MATVEKKLKTLDVYLLYDGEKVTISDTADDDKATRALNEFKKYGSMHYETEEGGEKVTNEIPYHAVQYIEVTEADGSVEKPDPYGCEGGSEPTTPWTLTGTYAGSIPRNGTLPNDNNPNYPVGRYAWDHGGWVYQGEPTNVVTVGIVEVYKENEEIKSHSVNEFCTDFSNDTVNAETHTIKTYLMTCM